MEDELPAKDLVKLDLSQALAKVLDQSDRKD